MNSTAKFVFPALLSLLFLIVANNLSAQACNGISFSMEHYEPCKFRAKYNNTTDCFNEIRYILASGTFASWDVNAAAGFTIDVVSPSELWIHHNQGFLPFGDQVPLLFTLPTDLNTTMLVAYNDQCAQVGCELLGGIPIESCPDPQDASIIGLKYRECGSLPYSNQPLIPGWTIQLLDAMGNVIGEQVTDADGAYAFYDLHAGYYIIREANLPDWTAHVPATGEYALDLGASEQVVRNFGNCPSCSCDSIYLNLSQLPGSNDTNTYYLNISNNGAYCFQYIDIKIDTGQLVNWNQLLPNWTTSLQGSNFLRLSPVDDYIPGGASIPLNLLVSGMGNHYFTVSAFMGNGFGGVACNRSYSFPGNPVPLSNDCCPSGAVQGPELVTDGTFDSPTQFSWTGYSYVLASGSGNIFVVTSPQIPSLNNQWLCPSKSGLLTDPFLFVDGSQTPGAIAWQQSVPVAASTQYSFSAAIHNLYLPTLPLTPDPTVELSIVDGSNNTVFQTISVLSENPDSWVQLCGLWTAPATLNPPYTLGIRTTSNGAAGNDFAVDCISFRSCTVPCTANFSFVDNGCGEISFIGIGTGTPSLTYAWDFGDNTGTLLGQNQVHQYLTGGNFTVSLVVTDATNCTATFSSIVTVPSVPNVTITANPGLNFCQGQSTTLTASGGAGNSYDWNNSAGGQSISVSIGGSYCVTCTDVNGCTSTACVTVTEDQPPVADAGPDQMICIGQSALLTATGGGTYQWSPSGSSSNPYTVSPVVTTTYTVTVTLNGCSSTDQVTVVIKPQPNVNAGPDQVICAGESAILNATGSGGGGPPFSYLWNPGASITNPFNTGPLLGTVTYTVVVTDANGCTEADNTTVIVNSLPNADAGTDQVICLGQSVTLTATGGISYQWSPNGSTNNPYSPNPITTTTYMVTVTGANGCTATDQVMVTVNPLPNASAGPDRKICIGQINPTPLIASGGVSYLWAPGNSIANPYFVGPNVTTIYTVTVTNVFGCTATDQVMVTVNPLPIVDAGPDQTICAGQSATLSVSAVGGLPPYLYNWGWGWPFNPYTVSPSSDDTYTGYAKDANGCTGSDVVKIDVINCCQSSLVQNWDFTQGGTPVGYDDIIAATNWEGIWNPGPGTNRSGDYWDPNSFFSAPVISPFTPTCFAVVPNFTQGNYAGFMCMYSAGTIGKSMRQGILNNLNGTISPGSGYYKVAVQIACPCLKFGTPKMVVYGVRAGQNTRIVPGIGFPNGPYAIIPSNGNLFGPLITGAGAKELGTIIVPKSNCDDQFKTYSFVFNSANLSGPIDRIFLTRKDKPAGNTYLAIDQVCIEKVSDPSGNNCHCAAAATGTILQTGSGFSSPISCNSPQPYVQLPCRRKNYSTYLFGSFPCNSSNCGSNNTVTWVLNGPGVQYSGTSNAWVGYPSFTIAMPWWYFSASGGSYTMTITRQCGTNTCSCDFNFSVAPCPCLCDNTFKPNVDQGFSISSPTTLVGCVRNLQPAALCANDLVSWGVSNVGSFGPSSGNNIQQITFPGPGVYQVCMIVTRTVNGAICGVEEKCQTVVVNCLVNPNDTITKLKFCDANNVKNGDFRDTANVVGLLNDSGWVPEWDFALNYGDGQVFVEDSTGANDEGHVVLTGGKDNFAGIYQEVNLQPDSFLYMECYVKNYLGVDIPEGTNLEVRLQENPFPEAPYQILHKWHLDTNSGWDRKSTTISMPFDTSLKYLIICLQSDDPSRRSVIGLDNFEICSSSTPPVGTHETALYTTVRIFPNPNSGTFKVELPEPAKPGMTFRIFDLTGKLLSQQSLIQGVPLQTVQTNKLPPGLYFLHFLAEGKLLAVEKFVKQ